MSQPPQMLKRELGVFGATMMGLGSILGTGVFVSIGIAAGVAGPSVILAIGIAALVAICNGLSSDQLAANHAVSGGQPYENRRFLQSALTQGNLQTVLLNLDSFNRHPKQLKFQYGFNEGLLRVDEAGAPNTQASWHRFFAATLSGAAVGTKGVAP